MIRIILLISVFLAAPVHADQWCQWDGTQGVECQSDSKGYIVVPNGFKVSTESIANGHGLYHLTITEPSLGTNQVKDVEVWGLIGNQMSLTWTVRDLTTDEIDAKTASPMPLSEYYLWKALIIKGVITTAEAAAALPQELIDAYLARDRIETQ